MGSQGRCYLDRGTSFTTGGDPSCPLKMHEDGTAVAMPERSTGRWPVEVDDDGDIIEPDPADPEACDSWK